MVKPVCEDPKARKKAKHREAMVEFRLNKKQKQNNLLLEHRRLEDRMKALVAAAKAAAARTGGTTDTLQKLVVEREILRSQNIALREEIQRHEKFKKIVLEARDDPMEKEESTLLSGDGESGWRVRFEDAAEPSFHFHPFTRDEFDTKIKQFESELKTGKASLVKVGSFFGWDVLRAPLVSASDGKSLLARSKVSKRLRCSLDVHQKMSYTKQKDLSPLVVTPMGWGLHKRTNVSTQVLQEFDQDSIVFVHSIPGPEKALRYFFQVRRAQWTLRDGRRKLMASLVITDSEANRRSREAEDSHDKVEWATEGAINVSVTEVDDNSIDVVCDHWAACESELHAEYLMIQWTQFAVWWEQLIVPTNLLLQKT
ncbi:unnamed protein product [Phytophthora lilii]|uniref:Unnamed protein product n=1 Tax=Phytophthora lilii TaxID=2077276 RepID=A0A9W6XBV1_9STRA|nr:unnamed protein product [Phytophthora lilii]